VPGEGIVLRGRLERLPRRRHGRPVHLWPLDPDPGQLAAMRGWLRGHINTTRIYRPGAGDVWRTRQAPEGGIDRTGWTYHPTELDYSVWWNCHDYTLEALRRAGLLEAGKPSLAVTADALETLLRDRFGEPVRPPLDPGE
jgi:hypothetical protein